MYNSTNKHQILKTKSKETCKTFITLRENKDLNKWKDTLFMDWENFQSSIIPQIGL